MYNRNIEYNLRVTEGIEMKIGDLIKRRRKQIGITQKELANGLCTQGTISKIEKDTLMPSSSLLKELADRLEVSISYFYGDPTTSINDNRVNNLIKEVQLALNQNENEKVLKLLKQNQRLIDSLFDTKQRDYFKMVQAHLDYYLFEKKETAICQLNSLLEVQQIDIALKIDVLCILGIIHYEEKRFKKANNYFEKAIALFNDSVLFEVRARTLYNYALNLEDLGQDKKAMDITLEGIELLKKYQSMYILGYFYSYKGYLFDKFNDIDEALRAYGSAAVIFDILNYTIMHAFVRVNLSELTQKKEDTHEQSN